MPTRWTEPEGEKFALGALEEQEHWQSEYYRIVSETSEQTRSTEADAFNGAQPWVGLRLPRNDALYKVRGMARYAANLSPDGMLHCRFVRSEHPHARLLNIDVSRARTAPGVCAVLTAADIAPERLLIGTLTEDTPGPMCPLCPGVCAVLTAADIAPAAPDRDSPRIVSAMPASRSSRSRPRAPPLPTMPASSWTWSTSRSNRY